MISTLFASKSVKLEYPWKVILPYVQRRESGFTLIELLVVIAIIGILSSVVLASLNGARKKGRDARRISDLKQIQTALEMYADANTTEYPDTYTSVATTYMQSAPTDPQGGNYLYDNLTNALAACVVASGICSNYVIGATLEDATHAALASDIDGTVGAITCTDPVYCVHP